MIDYSEVNRSANKEILGVNTVADGIPVFYLIAAFAIFVSGMVFMFTIGLLFGFVYMLILPLSLILIFGRDPSAQLQRMNQPKRYFNRPCTLFFDAAGLPQTPKPDKAGKLASVQENFPLKTYGQVNIGGQAIGYRLFHWNSNDIKVVFDLEIQGLDSTLPPATVNAHLTGVNNALCQLETEIKCIWDVRASCAAPLAHIATQIQHVDDPLTIAQLSAEADRLVALKQSRRVVQSTLRYQIKCRLGLQDMERPPESPADILLDWLDHLIPGFLKPEKSSNKAVWEKAIRLAYERMYKETFELITGPSGMGVTARPLTAQEICDWDYRETHTDGLTVPQCQILDQHGLANLTIDDHANHALYRLFEPRGGREAIPRFKDHCAYLPQTQQWVGAIRFADLRTMPQIAGSVEKGFLEFFYRKLCPGGSLKCDFRLVTEILPDNQFWPRYLLEQTYRNSVRREDKAALKRDVDVVARERRRLADQNLEWLNQGAQVVSVGMALFLFAASEKELEKLLTTVANQFSSTSCQIVQHRFSYVYFSQMALSSAPLLTFPTSSLSGPRHYIHRTTSLKAVTAIPQIQPPPMDAEGILLLGQELPIPYYWDIVGKNPNHTLITGETGTGKSLLMLKGIQAYINAKQSGVIFDFPPPNGQSTYEPMVATLSRLGVSATYQSVDRTVINIMGLPDLSWIDDLPAPGDPGYYPQQPTRASAIEYIIQNKLRILEAITGLNHQAGTEVELMRRALSLCFSDFYQTHLQRYETAARAPFGSDAAATMPIYSEFVDYAQTWLMQYTQVNEVTEEMRSKFDALYLLLKGALSASFGRSINGISAFDTNVDILVLALTNVSSSQDSLIYGLSGFDLLLRKAMSARKTLLMLDEGSELFEHAIFAQMLGSICNSGRKWGCNVVVGMTGLKPLLDSPAASKVIANLQNKLVSKINDDSYQILTQQFGFRRENLERMMNAAYHSNQQLQESYFLWQRDRRELFVKYCPDNVTLGEGANSKAEGEARNRMMANFADPVKGITAFGQALSTANAQGLDPSTLGGQTHAA